MNPLRQKLLTAITSVLLLLCGLEGFARIALGVRPTVERFQLSHELGWEWTPGYDTVETYHGVDYRMAISGQGLRNEEIVVPKPHSTYRIVVLGDSITEGPGVDLSGTFVKLLEQLLQAESPDRMVEVINAGTGDYGTQQEFIWLQERGLAYEPDLVILAIYLNDSRGFSSPPALVAKLNNFLVARSAFYVLYRNIIRGRMVTQAEASPDFRFRFSGTWKSRAWITDSVALTQLIQEADQDWGMAWDYQELARIENGLGQIIRLADRHDFRLLLTIFPVDAQVYAQVDTPLDLDRPQKELVAFAQHHGVPVLDLLPILRDLGTDDLFYDQAHLKPETHHIVADALFHALHKHQLPPSP
jgi:lysophospholipase L1-like esterase